MIVNNLEAILAVDDNFGISKDGKIPWKNKKDMNFFKTKTTEHIVLMGSNTLLSLPNQSPLPNRLNIILTNKPKYYENKYSKFNNIAFYNYVELLAYLPTYNPDKTIFIIGGKQIYDLFMPLCSKIWLTKIKGNYDCDLFVPIRYENYASENIYSDENMYIQCLSSIISI
jgi:dihydrofolate reductase